MKWTAAEARQRFSEVLKQARREPQLIYNRNQPVAAVVDMETFEEFVDWRERKRGESIGAAFENLRHLCAEEAYTLRLPAREDRVNPFTETADELPG